MTPLARILALGVRLVTECIGATDPSSGDKKPLFNPSQWSRLRRHGLPLQLQVTWQRLFMQSLHHRHQLCMVVVSASAQQPMADMIRGAETTALAVFKESRRLLTDEPFLGKVQTVYAQQLYDQSLSELVKLRAQGYMQDAEHALNICESALARTLSELSKRAWWALDAESTPTDAAISSSLLESKQQIDSATTGLPAAVAAPVSDEQAVAWREGLGVECSTLDNEKKTEILYARRQRLL